MNSPSTQSELENLIKERVELALRTRRRLTLAKQGTDKEMSPDERRIFLTRAFAEITDGIGVDRFLQIPVEQLDQFAVMSVTKRQDPAALLRNLVQSFLVSYACPETSAQAINALAQLEALFNSIDIPLNKQRKENS